MTIDIEHNTLIQTEEDKKNILFLLNLFNTKPKHFAKMLTSKKNIGKYGEILKWIDSKVPTLVNSDYPYNICTKLNWIFHGRTAFKECEHPSCHNLLGIGCDMKVNVDYGKHCSRKCKATNPAQITQIKKTKKEKYGNENFVNVEKAKQTKFERYGDPNYQNMDAVYKTKQERYGDPFYNNREKEKETVKKHIEENQNYYQEISKKCKKTKLELYGNPNYINSEKQKETWSQHKIDDPNFIKDRQEKIKKTTLERHGFVSPFELKETQEKSVQTMLKRYGVKYSRESKEIRKKLDESNERKFGVKNCWANKEIRKQIERTNLEKYGTPYGRSKKKYRYDGIEFDTSFELIYFIYMKLQNKNVERNLSYSFVYEYNGVSHRYFPDFKTDEGFVEMKGDHFFAEDGTMRNPWKGKDWTEEQKKESDALYEAKHQCMLKNDVKIFRSKDVSEFSDYIRKALKINDLKKYLKQFEIDAKS